MAESVVENLPEPAALRVQHYFAHSTDDGSKADWQLLSLHLAAVGAIAGASAAWFGGRAIAEVAGLLHDVGKYTDEFQRRIAGHSVRVDHATRGAMLAVERYGSVGWLLAYGIAGHHAGLANGVESVERTALQDRLKGSGLPPMWDDWMSESRLPERLTPPKLRRHSKERGGFQAAFFTRMLFSCLVDADYLDTEAFYDKVEGRNSARGVGVPSLIELRAALDRHLLGFRPDRPVNQV